MTSNLFRKALPIIAIAIPATVQAHPGHGALDLVAGVAHPLLGADHLIAMVAVGLLGAQLGGRSRWAVPSVFVSALAAGALAGTSGFAIPGMEHGIALSVLVLGSLIASSMRLSLPVAATFAAVFGALHGVAHGVEMPTGSWAYGSGFILASIALHAAGAIIGTACMAASRPGWIRVAGAAMAIGFCFL